MTQQEALELFAYQNGALTWKATNKPAGALKRNGYYLVKHKGKFIGLHRIVFLMHNGYLPEMVDHIDGNNRNNAIENLRAATRAQNNMNSKIYASNTSGFRNVYRDRHKYAVRLKIDGRLRSFGRFEDAEFADLVAAEARAKFHGQFANESLRARVAALEA
jgi:hypothetical protein